jgi:hypothetical protein
LGGPGPVDGPPIALTARGDSLFDYRSEAVRGADAVGTFAAITPWSWPIGLSGFGVAAVSAFSSRMRRAGGVIAEWGEGPHPVADRPSAVCACRRVARVLRWFSTWRSLDSIRAADGDVQVGERLVRAVEVLLDRDILVA